VQALTIAPNLNVFKMINRASARVTNGDNAYSVLSRPKKLSIGAVISGKSVVNSRKAQKGPKP